MIGNDEYMNDLFVMLFDKISECGRRVENLENNIEILRDNYERINRKTQNMATDIHLANIGLLP